MSQLGNEVDLAVAEAVNGLHARGYSWAEIGSRLGITRQAVQQRWGERPQIVLPNSGTAEAGQQGSIRGRRGLDRREP